MSDAREHRRRSALDSIAYALCEHDENGDGDYGNDHLADVIHAQLVADGHLLVDDDTARLVALGKAVEAMERRDERSSVIGNGMWNACLDAIYRNAGVTPEDGR